MFLALALAFCVPCTLLASGIGSEELGILASVISGNIGLAIGLTLALFGFYIFFMEQRTWGLFVMILGALFTAIPGFFVAAYNGANPIINAFGGSRGTLTIN